jgi:hypothetical protein
MGRAACLVRQGELRVLGPGAVGVLVPWRLDGSAFAGALSDWIEALLRCGPARAYNTVVGGGRPCDLVRLPTQTALVSSFICRMAG